ncbi:hypothetical protein [Leptolyngbya iicbica]|uniref:Uncharacterized protein n=2 Tax=Cyanophyceae TaxID=3028117 RepID=A0A4Q7E5W4_9CYAN|nr:hypothetical protein [Leptolyngbya sp. LK]RZM77350.1 hypothetical protein DYY88_17080 [Leptolyngbya sp. LK]
MASHLTIYTPSPRSQHLMQASIVLLVLLTGIASALLVRSQLQRYEMQPHLIPIANGKTWEALGR